MVEVNKKTLLITFDFWPNRGGVAKYHLDLADDFKAGDIFVLAPELSVDARGDDTYKLSDHIKVERRKMLARFGWPKWWPIYRQAKEIIKKEKIEKIWVGNILPIGTVALLMKKFLKIDFYITCHGLDLLEAYKNKRKRILAYKVLGKAEKVIVNSEFTAGILKEKYGDFGDKVEVRYPQVKERDVVWDKNTNKEVGEFIQKNIVNDAKIIFSIGRHIKRKNFGAVIESMKLVWKNEPQATYVLAGRGEEADRLKDRAEKVEEVFWGDKIDSNNRGRIIILGEINEAEKWAWLKRSKIFVMCPKKTDGDVEGFGIVYLEAGYAGCKVVGSDVGGVPEALGLISNSVIVKDSENVKEVGGVILNNF